MAFFYTFVNNISYKLKMNWSLTMQEMSQNPDQETLEYVFNQTMLRIKDPEKSIDFYTKVLGMTILKKLDFPDFKFSLYIRITVPDVYEACERFESLGVEFQKKPDDGNMKGLAFIKDPDGYWIEILSAKGLASTI